MPGQENPTEQLVSDRFDTEVYAVFGQVAYDLTENLEAALALRYDHEERQVTNLVPTQAEGASTAFITCTGQPFVGGDPINPGLCVDPTGASGDKKKTFDQWQPKLSLRWDVTESLITYGSVGVGFKSGGFNNFGSQATIDQNINSLPTIQDGTYDPVGIKDDYDDETSTSYEIGFKSDIGDRFRWEGAAYYIDVDDQQFFEFFVGQFGLLRVVSNIDEMEIKGIELGVTWQAYDNLDLYANGNWIDSEMKQNSSRPDTVGNEAPYTPSYTFALGGNFTWPLTSDLNLIANLNINGVGDTWFHAVQNNPRPTIFDPVFGTTGSDMGLTERDAYALMNMRVGVQGEHWTVVVYGHNITDEDYIEEVIPAPEFGGSFDAPGGLSRFGLEATYKF